MTTEKIRQRWLGDAPPSSSKRAPQEALLSMNSIATTAGMALLAAAALSAVRSESGAPRVYPDRWVFVMRAPRTDQDVMEIGRIARDAGQHGLNGLVLSGGLDTLDLQPPEFFRHLDAVKEICRRNHLELIPQVFSAGYGGAILAHDPNLAEGLPVEGAPFVVRTGEARLIPDQSRGLVNGGFEE